MVKARSYLVTQCFRGRPKLTDFQIVEKELPPLKNGEILVKTEYISLDPYLLFANATVQLAFKVLDDSLPYEQRSFQVVQSRHEQYPVSTQVVSHQGWKDHYIVDPDAPQTEKREIIHKIPDLQGLPTSLAVGAVGMPGASGYLAFMDTRPMPGETVVVTGAADAVGIIVGQIAKIKGFKVIVFAGSDDKVSWLKNELGFDKAFNYKKQDVLSSLEQAASEGVDIYFDNVGGEISSTIMKHMNVGGRVSVFGSISSYSDAVLPKVTILQPTTLFKELEIKGFMIWSWSYYKWEKAYADLVKWIKNGDLKVKEHVTEGFDNVARAFIGMLLGDNIEKAVVKV